MKPMSIRATALMVALVIGAAACGGTNNNAGSADAASPATSQPTTTATSQSAPAEDFSDLGALPGEKVQPADVEWGDIDHTDQRLFTITAEIDETFRTRAADVWNDNFRFDQTPLAFAYRDNSGEITKMYVLHHPEAASLAGAAKVALDESLDLGDVYRIDPPDNITNIPAHVPFDFFADVGGKSSMLFFIPEDDPFLSPATWDFARFVVHETFHRYQIVDNPWKEAYPDGTEYPRDAENAALALLEGKVLAAMIDSSDIDVIRHRLAQFVAIRQARAAAFDLGNLAPAQEAAEGTARYVENRYAEVNDRPGQWTSPIGDDVSLEWLSFGRFYDTGAQLSWALDQLGADWKQAVEDGKSLTDLALDIVDLSDPFVLVEEAKNEFAYNDILANAEAADLENAENTSPMMDADITALVQCLLDEGLPVDTTLAPEEALDKLSQQFDPEDPEVTAALETCGIGVGTGPAPGAELGDSSGGDSANVGQETLLTEQEAVSCLTDAGIDATGFDDINLDDSDVVAALEACIDGQG